MNFMLNSSKIKGVVFDLDGVFTDGKIHVFRNEQGEIVRGKSYYGKDSYALKLLQNNNIKVGIITADNEELLSGMKHIVERCDRIYCDSYDKLPALKKIKKEWKLDWSELAYMGDDVPDIVCLNQVGQAVCPCDAINEVKDVCNYICKSKGGKGAVREFVDWILS